jgi:hypothetical protein
MKLSEETVRHIIEQAAKTPYGKITVVLSEQSGFVDVITESRQRFPIPAPGKLILRRPKPSDAE